MGELKKRTKIIAEKIDDKNFLCYNPAYDDFLVMPESLFETYSNNKPKEISSLNPTLYQKLADNNWFIEDDKDEVKLVLEDRKQRIEDCGLYCVMLNTTLDCNLNCWYCYENKILGSKTEKNVIDGIKRHIIKRYSEKPFEILKLSFFGGEPFMDFKTIKELACYARNFCIQRDVSLILDFTTNATLIDNSIVEFLKDFRCHFQITLDGGRKSHNRIKKSVSGEIPDTYAATIESIKLLNDGIPDRFIAVRLNFDANSLKDIDEIINDIDFLERKKSIIIMRKVWQVGEKCIEKEDVVQAILALQNKNFLIDYYQIPKGNVCFAERESEVLFNYDGKVFKCSTICSFNDENALGKFDTKSGDITWNSDISKWYVDMQQDYCKECEWFAACLGVCNKQRMAYGIGKRLCNFDNVVLSRKEYLMYLFRNRLIYKNLMHDAE